MQTTPFPCKTGELEFVPSCRASSRPTQPSIPIPIPTQAEYQLPHVNLLDPHRPEQTLPATSSPLVWMWWCSSIESLSTSSPPFLAPPPPPSSFTFSSTSPIFFLVRLLRFILSPLKISCFLPPNHRFFFPFFLLLHHVNVLPIFTASLDALYSASKMLL